jgi:hypothetical protein
MRSCGIMLPFGSPMPQQVAGSLSREVEGGQEPLDSEAGPVAGSMSEMADVD